MKRRTVSMQTLIEITNEQGELVEAEWLHRAERVHRQLRPALPPEYEARLRRVFAAGASGHTAIYTPTHASSLNTCVSSMF